MPTLARRRDGGYIVRHFYRDFSTWQLTREGVAYLQRREIPDEGRFDTEWFMHLWMNGWVYTGEPPTQPPGPFVIGDRNAPTSLRTSIKDFHVALWNRQFKDAWEMTMTASVLDRDLIGRLVGLDSSSTIDAIQQQIRDAFRTKAVQSGLLEISQWTLRDLRVGATDFEYVATVGTVDPLTMSHEWNEHWVNLLGGWRIRAELLFE